MIQIHTLSLGSYQTNCYIIHDKASTSCCIIDPGFEAEIISSFLKDHSLVPEAILLTHGHFDHVGAVKDLAADWDCEVYLCEEDTSLPPMLTAGTLYFTKTYAEGSHLDLSELSIDVIQTPGHTPGSVCLLCENAMFAGDTLFARSCGRTDLPGGSQPKMNNSLRRLASIDKDYSVYPGHGPSTTLSDERKYNPYL